FSCRAGEDLRGLRVSIAKDARTLRLGLIEILLRLRAGGAQRVAIGPQLVDGRLTLRAVLLKRLRSREHLLYTRERAQRVAPLGGLGDGLGERHLTHRMRPRRQSILTVRLVLPSPAVTFGRMSSGPSSMTS